MKKLRADTHAAAMIRAVGLPKAYQVATRLAEATKSNNYNSLPKGEIFYTKDFGGNLKLKQKALDKNHNFWQHVVGSLNKEFKK